LFLPPLLSKSFCSNPIAGVREGKRGTKRLARRNVSGPTHQDVDFPVNLEAEVTLDTFLTEHVDVDSLVLAA